MALSAHAYLNMFPHLHLTHLSLAAHPPHMRPLQETTRISRGSGGPDGPAGSACTVTLWAPVCVSGEDAPTGVGVGTTTGPKVGKLTCLGVSISSYWHTARLVPYLAPVICVTHRMERRWPKGSESTLSVIHIIGNVKWKDDMNSANHKKKAVAPKSPRSNCYNS